MSRRRWIADLRGKGRGLIAGVLAVSLGACAAPTAQTTGGANAPPAAPAPARARTAVTGLDVSGGSDGTLVQVISQGIPRFRMSRSEAPPAVILDMADVTLEGLAPRVEVGDGVVESVETQSLADGAGRITIRTTGVPEARVLPAEQGIQVLVTVNAGTAAAAAALGTEGPVVEATPDGRGVVFHLGLAPKNLSGFTLSDGRLVVDAEGVSLAESLMTVALEGGPAARVKLGRQEGRVRAVVEPRTPGALDGYDLKKTDDGFVLSVAAAAPEPAPSAAPPSEDQPQGDVVVASAVPAAQPDDPARWGALPGGGAVSDLGFRQDPDWSRIEVQLTRGAPHVVQEASGDRVVVDLLKTRVPRQFQRALDTSAFPGPVRLVSAYPRGADTRIVVDLKQPAPFRVERDETHLSLLFAGGSGAVVPEREPVVVLDEAGKAATAGPETATAEEVAPAGPVYTGRRLSMDFVDADIRNVLRLIGEVSGLNVVAGDDVQGKVTVRLIDVPWDQALDVILKTHGLGQVREDNVIRIAPAERLAAEAKRAMDARSAAKELEPLVTDILPVNYATAESLSEKIKSVLSDRGTVTVDQRTNALLIKDVAARVEEARQLVARLDTQTPQVLIEARIVEVGSVFSRDLGIQWGGQFTASTATGNATGWAFPHSIGVQGATGVQNYAVNFPSAGGAGGPGAALAMTLGHINDVLTLDLRLSAIETAGKGRVLSSPRVTTLDNKTAEISQGIEIPFTTATQEKIETQSIDYKLVLNVTPHVTADRSIIMKIDLTKDAPSTTYVAADSQTPAKETRAASTQVLVRDGETTVIGGIITETKSETESGVPYLSKIPFIGALFRQRTKRSDKTELIIFITPKIVTPDPAQVLSRSL